MTEPSSPWQSPTPGAPPAQPGPPPAQPPYGQQPSYGPQQPPYGQQEPYGQTAPGQPPYGQQQYPPQQYAPPNLYAAQPPQQYVPQQYAPPQYPPPQYPPQQYGPPMQPGPYGWQPFPPPPPQATNPWSVVALVCGILPLVPVAIGAGITALVQLRRQPARGKGLAVGGLIGALLWSIAIGLVVVAGTNGAFDVVPPLGTVSATASRTVGTCQLDRGDLPVGRVVACTSPHDEEVYLVAELRSGVWRGRQAVADEADDACYDAFEDYVGTSYEDSAYDYGAYVPDRDEWISTEHRVVCVILAYDDPDLRGSVAGTRR